MQITGVSLLVVKRFGVPVCGVCSGQPQAERVAVPRCCTGRYLAAGIAVKRQLTPELGGGDGGAPNG